jgi:hypothetical protein
VGLALSEGAILQQTLDHSNDLIEASLGVSDRQSVGCHPVSHGPSASWEWPTTWPRSLMP